MCNCKPHLGIGNYQSKKNFIEGNSIMLIKMKVGIQNLSFRMFVPSLILNFEKYWTTLNMAFLGGWIFAEKMNSSSISNFHSS